MRDCTAFFWRRAVLHLMLLTIGGVFLPANCCLAATLTSAPGSMAQEGMKTAASRSLQVEETQTAVSGGPVMAKAPLLEADKTYISNMKEGYEAQYWFCFRTGKRQEVYTVAYENLHIGFPVYAYLQTAQKKVLRPVLEDYARLGMTKYMRIKLEADTVYYLHFTRDGGMLPAQASDYRFTITHRVDSEPDTWEKALKIKKNRVTGAYFEGGGDTDWFTFTAGRAGIYRFCLQKEWTTDILPVRFYNKNGEEIDSDVDLSSSRMQNYTFYLAKKQVCLILVGDSYAETAQLGVGSYVFWVEKPSASSTPQA